MFRRVLALLLVGVCLLAGCAAPASERQPLTDEVAVHEGEGYRLTYPAAFSLTRETGEALFFTAKGYTMAFSITREDNPYGLVPAEEYLEMMGIYDGVVPVDSHAFAVEKHIPNMLSAYLLYTFSEEYIYLLEYTYGGTEEERALASLFSVETK